MRTPYMYSMRTTLIISQLHISISVPLNELSHNTNTLTIKVFKVYQLKNRDFNNFVTLLTLNHQNK